jgi:sterol desaturase/sphingolipid hydroxylase (fatty acid hydroxylase superfamily)
MIRAAAIYLISHAILFSVVVITLRIVFLTAIEKRYPARPVSYSKVMWRDVGAALVFGLAVLPAADFLGRWVAFRPAVPTEVLALPLLWRVFLYLAIADFGHYWVHRLMHTQHFWRVHKWHHYPTYMYWLAGARGSVLQQVMVNVPYIFAGVLLSVAPAWMAAAIALKNTAQNDWMHLNVRWGTRWLEWIIVTPRYHHIHHSDNPEHYRGNLGSMFTIWDRLFGTYVNPEVTPRELTFGIGETVPAVRLTVGI